jgi:Secretion system C-terminal sorting domain
LGDGTVVDKHSPVQISVPGCSLGNEQFGEEGNSLKIYPNPAHDVVSIVYDSSSNALEIAIYDLTGKQLELQTMQDKKGIATFDTSKYANGIYVVVLKEDGVTVQQQKLIIE